MAKKNTLPHLHVVLLCEDYGERLWPIARENGPACAAPVSPGSQETLLKNALDRFMPYTDQKIHVVTTLRLASVVDCLLAGDCGLKMEQYELLVQPTTRGSAFAVALACARIRKLDPQAVVVISRTDQRTTTDERWEHALLDAYRVAADDYIAVFCSSQQTKCADWTYVRAGKPFAGEADATHVRVFSADQAPFVATRACAQGAYWYTGTCMARAALLLGELNRVGEKAATPQSEHAHRIAETANFLAQLDPGDWLHVAAQEIIEALPCVSLDKALLEASKKTVLVDAGIRFDALSTLDDLDVLTDPDVDGNRVIGDSVLERCRNTTVYSKGCSRKVVTLGLRDTLVIELDDMTLVVAKDQLDSIDAARLGIETHGDWGQDG